MCQMISYVFKSHALLVVRRTVIDLSLRTHITPCFRYCMSLDWLGSGPVRVWQPRVWTWTGPKCSVQADWWTQTWTQVQVRFGFEQCSVDQKKSSCIQVFACAACTIQRHARVATQPFPSYAKLKKVCLEACTHSSPSKHISTSYPLMHELDLVRVVPDADEQIPNDLHSSRPRRTWLVLDFGLFVLINLYCPNEGSDARLSLTSWKVYYQGN